MAISLASRERETCVMIIQTKHKFRRDARTTKERESTASLCMPVLLLILTGWIMTEVVTWMESVSQILGSGIRMLYTTQWF